MPRTIKPRPVKIPIGPSIAYVPLTQRKFALIDKQDAERVGKYRWSARKDGRVFYAYGWTGDYVIALHRFLLGLAPGDKMEGDHANRNTLDFRRCNLRLASHGQNMCNRAVLRSTRSKIKGLYLVRGNRWRVRITHAGRGYHIGYFPLDQKDAAIAAYAAAAQRLHGEFARTA